MNSTILDATLALKEALTEEIEILDEPQKYFWDIGNTIESTYYAIGYDSAKIRLVNLHQRPHTTWENCSVWFSDWRYENGTVPNIQTYDIVRRTLCVIRSNIDNCTFWLLPPEQRSQFPIYDKESNTTVRFRVRKIGNAKKLLATIIEGRDFTNDTR